MSKCKRMLLQLSAPAFDLSVVQETSTGGGVSNSDSLTHDPVNAAACEEMSEILDFLVLGSWRDAENPEKLRSRGVSHVLNVAKEVPSTHKERLALESGDFTHKCIPLQDCHEEDLSVHFEEAFAFIEEARRVGGKVLVHCRRGISRSPAIVVGYLMRHEGFSFSAALDYVKARRRCVSLNLAFRSLLEEYTPPSRVESSGADEFGLSLPASESGGIAAKIKKENAWGPVVA